MIEHLSQKDIRNQASEFYREGGGSAALVCRLEINGRQYILKDYRACDRWYAAIIGPLLTWREVKAMQMLEYIDGFPRLIDIVENRAMLTEYFPNTVRSRQSGMSSSPEFFEKLTALILSMHQAGVAHGDLRRSSNILVDTQGNPYIVDFTSCFFRGARWNLLSDWIFHRLCKADINAIAKLKNRVAPELLTDEEKDKLHHGTFDHVFRYIGDLFRRLSRFLFTRTR